MEGLEDERTKEEGGGHRRGKKSQSCRCEGRARSANALRTASMNDYWLIMCVSV